MQNIYQIKDVVMNQRNEIFVIMGMHPSIPQLYIVEDHDCNLHYMKESVMISLC